MLVALLLPLALSVASAPPPTPENLLPTLEADGRFEMVLAGLRQSGLADTLADGTPHTLFAPTDEAILALPAEIRDRLLDPENAEALLEMLRHHTVTGALTLEQFGRTARVPSLQGSDLALRQLEDGGYGVDVGRLLESDIACDDGVLHVVDAVLLPPGFELISEAELFGRGRHRYTVDAGHSSILFRVIHTGTGAAWGSFGDFQGEIVVDTEDPGSSSILLAVSVDSLDTGDSARDRYLLNEDFFDATTHPVLSFRSTAVEAEGEDGDLRVTGELSLRGVTQELVFEVGKVGEGRFGPRHYRVGYEARGSFLRSDHGMTFGIPGVAGDEISLIIALEGSRELEGG